MQGLQPANPNQLHKLRNLTHARYWASIIWCPILKVNLTHKFDTMSRTPGIQSKAQVLFFFLWKMEKSVKSINSNVLFNFNFNVKAIGLYIEDTFLK